MNKKLVIYLSQRFYPNTALLKKLDQLNINLLKLIFWITSLSHRNQIKSFTVVGPQHDKRAQRDEVVQ